MIAKAHPSREGDNDVLPIDEIRARYDGQWVLITDPEINEACEVLRGHVAYHSPNRKEVWAAAADVSSNDIAVFYVGDIPSDTVYVL
jgi:hypothetical protein